MTLFGLRLLVALLTFAFGVGAAWLFNFESKTRYDVAVGASDYAPVSVATSRDESKGSCSYNKPRTVEGGIISGKALSKPVPAYPAAAKAAGVGGTVSVRVVVDESGKVSSAEAVSGPELLREAAADAALKASFAPTRLSGQPVKVSGFITYNFVLN